MRYVRTLSTPVSLLCRQKAVLFLETKQLHALHVSLHDPDPETLVWNLNPKRLLYGTTSIQLCH